MIFRRLPASSSFVLAAARLKAAKLRIGRVCQWCLIRWRVEAVGAEAGAGEEPQPCPLAELGEHVPGLDAEEDGQVVAASVAVVKLARSGSVPGRVSTAVTIAMRSSWYRVSRSQVSCSRPGRSPERSTRPWSRVCRSAKYADSISQRSW